MCFVPARSTPRACGRSRRRNRIYCTREEARSDVVDYIEVFYNRQRWHGHLGGLRSIAFETAASNG